MKNLFLVTRKGERHEDHIPLEFVDFETLKRNYPFDNYIFTDFYAVEEKTEEYLSDGKWHELVILSSDYKWTEEEKEDFRTGKYTYVFFECEKLEYIHVICVKENMKIPRT